MCFSFLSLILLFLLKKAFEAPNWSRWRMFQSLGLGQGFGWTCAQLFSILYKASMELAMQWCTLLRCLRLTNIDTKQQSTPIYSIFNAFCRIDKNWALVYIEPWSEPKLWKILQCSITVLYCAVLLVRPIVTEKQFLVISITGRSWNRTHDLSGKVLALIVRLDMLWLASGR